MTWLRRGALLHGEEKDIYSDAGYQGVGKRTENESPGRDVNWHVAMRSGKHRALPQTPKGPAPQSNRASEVAEPSKGEAPLLCAQESARLSQDALSRVNQEYLSPEHPHGTGELEAGGET